MIITNFFIVVFTVFHLMFWTKGSATYLNYNYNYSYNWK